MELQELVPVRVRTFHDNWPELEVRVYRNQEGISTKEVYEKATFMLNLKQSSIEHFSLFLFGKKLNKRLRNCDYLPLSHDGLFLRKWCFDNRTEKLLLKDKVACHLIFRETEWNIENGFLKPSKDQIDLLEEYSDKRFRCEEKYVLLCHSIAAYFDVQLEDCVVLKNEGECKCHVKVNVSHLKINTSDVDVTVLPWFCVKQWTYEALPKKIIFVYINGKLMDETITVITDQVEYLADVINQCFKTIQKEDKNTPRFYSEMVSRTEEGNTSYQNPLFNLEKTQQHYESPHKKTV
ncbi:unnamed protein product [Mytilus coruscus]|uniref:FERM domain-containing protein n=1 Tax=Mytilus coruscus TaxID=42192 RepID=A0A6J8CRA6_MYTCO|nr:unnamed protein product [Mytilus coruscus]